MVLFVSGNIEEATEPMLFNNNSAKIVLKLELYLKNIFQIRSNTNTPTWYFSNTNICAFEYKYNQKL